jgi:hypothetical protein
MIIMKAYRIRDKRDLRLFKKRFKYTLNVTWYFSSERPVFYVVDGKFYSWSEEVEAIKDGATILYLKDFKDYIELIRDRRGICYLW